MSTTIGILIDSTVLRQDPYRERSSFKVLSRLACKGIIGLYVPEIAINEYRTSRELELLRPLSDAKSALNKMARNRYLSKAKEKSDKIKANIERYEDEIKTAILKDINNWIAKTNTEILPIEPEHTGRVFFNYFRGWPPFRSIKAREDFPDAYIYEAVIDLSNKSVYLIVISADKRLRKACGDVGEGLSVYKSLDELMDMELITVLLDEERTRDNADALAIGLRTYESLIIEKVKEELGEQVLYEMVVDSAIPSDDNSGTVYTYGEPEKISIDMTKCEYIAFGIFHIPVYFEIDVELSYPIFKADYYSLEDERVTGISIDELNEHYYNAAEMYRIWITGILQVSIDYRKIDKKKMEENVEQIIRGAKVGLDSIDEIAVLE